MNLHDCKKLIVSGDIKVFNDLFNHVTVAEVARSMGCSPKHVNYVRQNPEKLYFGELIKLSEALGMEYWKVGELFAE
jgi:hypothetical protein